jgi:hypothetical protein
MKWCVEYTEFCLVVKFKHKITSVCVQKIFSLALWSQKIKYFMQPCLVGSVDAVLTNAYVLELLWQEQAAEGDNEICGHLIEEFSESAFSINLTYTRRCI